MLYKIAYAFGRGVGFTLRRDHIWGDAPYFVVGTVLTVTCLSIGWMVCATVSSAL